MENIANNKNKQLFNILVARFDEFQSKIRKLIIAILLERAKNDLLLENPIPHPLQLPPLDPDPMPVPQEGETIALWAKDENWRTFFHRSKLSAKDNNHAFQNGDEFIEKLSASEPIKILDIHSHGDHTGIVIGGVKDNDSAFYLNNKIAEKQETAASTNDFVAAVKKGHIVLAKGAKITFFGCFNRDIARELAKGLGKIGRTDIKVIGADSSVYPTSSGVARAYRGAFFVFQGNKTVDRRQFIDYGSTK